MKADPLKTNLFAIANIYRVNPLHYCAANTTRVDVLQLIIDRFPHALIRSTDAGHTPLDYAQLCNPHRANHAAIVGCLEENIARYPALLNQLTVKCCLVRLKKQGMTAIVAATPLNEQTPVQFVYEILDLLVNSEDEGDGGGHHLLRRPRRGERATGRGVAERLERGSEGR